MEIAFWKSQSENRFQEKKSTTISEALDDSNFENTLVFEIFRTQFPSDRFAF